MNRDTGLLLVFAPERLQHEIREYLDVVTAIAKRQVLLEATVVEVILSNQYKQGIDWSFFNSLATNGLALYQGANVGGAAAALSYITEALDIPEEIRYFDDDNGDGQITAADASYANYRRFTTDPGISGEGVNAVVSFDTTAIPARGATPEQVDPDTSAETPAVPEREAQVEVTRTITGTRINQDATTNRAGGLSPIAPSGDNFITGRVSLRRHQRGGGVAGPFRRREDSLQPAHQRAEQSAGAFAGCGSGGLLQH